MMNQFLTVFLLLFGTALHAQHNASMSTDKPSTHGMLIFGKEKIYASHLPMFHGPHDYQIILELELTGTSRNEFVADQQLHPEFTTYTIEPEKFILPDKVNNKGIFKANLYRGHFERGGKQIASKISVKIKQVIFFKKFKPEESRSTTADYILIGNGKEQFLVHHITGKPDFEQIIQVKIAAGAFVRNALYTLVTLNNNENMPVGVSGNAIQVNDQSKVQQIVLLKQIYLEFEDLKQ